MRDGNYRTVNFASFRVSKFSPHLFSHELYGDRGCGACALSLLTGVSPRSLEKRSDWTSRYMRKFLADKGIKSVELTKRNLTNFQYPQSCIGPRHVVLAAIKLIKREASWIVLYDGLYFHNFEVAPMKPYGFINQPIMSAFALLHSDWVSEPIPIRASRIQSSPNSWF